METYVLHLRSLLGLLGLSKKFSVGIDKNYPNSPTLWEKRGWSYTIKIGELPLRIKTREELEKEIAKIA